MSLDWLRVVNFRNLARAELEPAAGINWLYGENGAGKTSVLEAIHVLGRGRSFRSSRQASLIRSGAPELEVVASLNANRHRLGVARRRDGWRGRIDGADSTRVSEFARLLPLVLIEPGSHALIEGGPDVRRSYLDWGLFHVEPGYLESWRRYAKLLRQRNAALKTQAPDALLESLEHPMAEAADRIDRLRHAHVEALQDRVTRLQESLRLRFTPPGLGYRPGQDAGDSLVSIWREARDRDRDLGFTRAGPHRADLKLVIDGAAAAPRLSRGQQKLCSLLLLFGLLELLLAHSPAPVLLLDDPVSELDTDHLERVLAWLAGARVQSWLTAVQPPSITGCRVFHVEHGEVRG